MALNAISFLVYERVKNHKAKARISRLGHLTTYNSELRLSGNHTMTEYEMGGDPYTPKSR